MHKQLTFQQRYYIFVAKERKKSISQIAKEINVHKSTVYRELKRNKFKGYFYYFKTAQNLAKNRQEKALKKASVLTAKMKENILEKLEKNWSPEQISGRLKNEKIFVSYQTIYRFIYKDKKKGGKLFKKLRHKGKRYKKQQVAGCKSRIIGRIGIEKRPEIINQKLRVGDWEIDTVIGANHKSALLTLVDRKTKFTVIEKLSGKNMKSVNFKTIKRLKKMPKKSITADNGTEFSGHKFLTKKLKIPVYFADPYSSWQRGLNEHTNGLIREFLPKKTDFREVSNAEIRKIEKNLNKRPRKVLDYKTPEEAMMNCDQFVAFRM